MEDSRRLGQWNIWKRDLFFLKILFPKLKFYLSKQLQFPYLLIDTNLESI